MRTSIYVQCEACDLQGGSSAPIHPSPPPQFQPLSSSSTAQILGIISMFSLKQ